MTYYDPEEKPPEKPPDLRSGRGVWQLRAASTLRSAPNHEYPDMPGVQAVNAALLLRIQD
jgi:hypothetical protein